VTNYGSVRKAEAEFNVQQWPHIQNTHMKDIHFLHELYFWFESVVLSCL